MRIRWRMQDSCESWARELRSELQSYRDEFFPGELAHLERLITGLRETADRIKQNDKMHASRARARA